MTVERMFPSGGWLCYAVHNGRYIARRYFGYTKKEAIQLFNRELKGL